MSETKKAEKTSRLRDYLRAHLAQLCVDYSDMTLEIQENKIHPERNSKPEVRIPFLRKLADEQLCYIKRVIRDLDSLEG